MADEEDLKLLRDGHKDLSKCDFRGADLSGADLSGCDLSGSHLENANVTRADLRGANLSSAHVSKLNLEGANLTGATLKGALVFMNLRAANLSQARISGILQKTILDGADLRGANFKGATINEGCSFEGALYDASTNFDGVKILRAIARLPQFSYYAFDRGVLTRRSDEPIPSPEAAVIPESPDRTGTDIEAKALSTATRVLLANPAQALQLTEGLSGLVATELEQLATRKPNEGAALEAYDRYVGLLEFILTQLDSVAELLRQIELQPEPGQSRELARSAGGVLAALGRSMESWCTEQSQKSITFAANVGLLGLGTLFLSHFGVVPAAAFPVLAFLMCGKEITGAAQSGTSDR